MKEHALVVQEKELLSQMEMDMEIGSEHAFNAAGDGLLRRKHSRSCMRSSSSHYTTVYLYLSITNMMMLSSVTLVVHRLLLVGAAVEDAMIQERRASLGRGDSRGSLMNPRSPTGASPVPTRSLSPAVGTMRPLSRLVNRAYTQQFATSCDLFSGL